MKKRILALMLAGAMVFGLAACGTDSGDQPDETETSSVGTGGEESSEPSGTNSDFKVGAIYINSKNDTAGYTYAHNNGITTAMEDLGLDVDSQLVVVDEVAEDYGGCLHRGGHPGGRGLQHHLRHLLRLPGRHG